jgi:hypothetical protein
MTRNDAGQALTEYAVVMAALITMIFVTAGVTNWLYDGAFFDLLSGFGLYSETYDLVLSLPFP